MECESRVYDFEFFSEGAYVLKMKSGAEALFIDGVFIVSSDEGTDVCKVNEVAVRLAKHLNIPVHFFKECAISTFNLKCE